MRGRQWRSTGVLALGLRPALRCGKDQAEEGNHVAGGELPERGSHFEERDGTQCPREGGVGLCGRGVHLSRCIRQEERLLSTEGAARVER